MASAKAINKIFTSKEVSEGAGLLVRRVMPTPKLRDLTPFVMLDHFASPANRPGNVPDHPHRGQEIISYIISGAVDHDDFLGNTGTIGPGDIQIMTVGRGIMHAEQPRRVDLKRDPPDSTVEGVQLWIDLPNELRYMEPRYRYIKSKKIPVSVLDEGRVTVKVIAGESHGLKAAEDLTCTPVWYYDISIKPGGRMRQIMPKDWNVFLYVLHGEVSVSNKSSLGQFQVAVFERDGDYVEIYVPQSAATEAKVVLFGGMPLDQKIVHYGPFVVSEEKEAHKAMIDFRLGINGFERALTWESNISKRISY
ncbi:RNA pol II transcription cofactor [Paecilomyces lecythidis]|uniref:RNA pol II transcription cofactor n=1 Tax=Paecilomyces lecythidis TaxID=3004212 RepID=A0ABR3X852_9EURO